MKPLFCLALLAILCGCAHGQPSAFERGIYNVTTQRVEVVVLRTNVTATSTNVVAVPGIIEIQHLDPKPEVATGIQTAGQIGATFGVPWLTPVLGLLGGLYAWWAEYRNSRKAKLNTVFAQNIETAREVIKAQPGGATTDDRFKEQIKAQQVDAGVKLAAADVVDATVNTVDAKASAENVTKP